MTSIFIIIFSDMFGTESLKMVWGNVQIDPHNAPSSFISQYKNKTIKTEVLGNSLTVLFLKYDDTVLIQIALLGQYNISYGHME